MLKALFEIGVREYSRYLNKDFYPAEMSADARYKTTVSITMTEINEEFPNGDYIGRVFSEQETSHIEKVTGHAQTTQTLFPGETKSQKGKRAKKEERVGALERRRHQENCR